MDTLILLAILSMSGTMKFLSFNTKNISKFQLRKMINSIWNQMQRICFLLTSFLMVQRSRNYSWKKMTPNFLKTTTGKSRIC